MHVSSEYQLVRPSPEAGPTSPVCDSSCSASLDGFVYALSHPSYSHLYRLSPGVADLERDFVTRLTGVGGEAALAGACLAGDCALWTELEDGPAVFSMSSGESIGAGLLWTAAILAVWLCI